MEVTDPDGLDRSEMAGKIHWCLFRIAAAMRRHETPQGGLTLPQCSMLHTLSERGRIRITDLAVYEGVRTPTTTMAIRRLVDLGLVSRLRDPSDHRIVWVEITRKGEAARLAAMGGLLGGMLTELGESELAMLDDVLPALEKIVLQGHSAAAPDPS